MDKEQAEKAKELMSKYGTDVVTVALLIQIQREVAELRKAFDDSLVR